MCDSVSPRVGGFDYRSAQGDPPVRPISREVFQELVPKPDEDTDGSDGCPDHPRERAETGLSGGRDSIKPGVLGIKLGHG